jgi:hypothetical protein
MKKGVEAALRRHGSSKSLQCGGVKLAPLRRAVTLFYQPVSVMPSGLRVGQE